jgi:hypothetical protein
MDLLGLAGSRFHAISSSEALMLRDSENGDNVPSIEDVFADADFDPNDYGRWGKDREVRSSLVHWLCTDQDALKHIDARGIQMYGSKLINPLDLSYVKLPFPITMWRCRAEAPINLLYASLPELDLQGSWIAVLEADRLKLEGSLFLRRGFRADSGIALAGAHIGSDLSLVGAKLLNQPRKGVRGKVKALRADRIVIGSSAFLRDKFSAEGDVELPEAQIGSDLDCSDATFHGQVVASGATVKGRLLWTEIQDSARATLRLMDASIGSLTDDKESWPGKGNLTLDGLSYHHIATAGISTDDRIRWLNLIPEFRPQPYRKLATVLKESGDERGGRRIMIEMERRLTGDTWYEQGWSCLLRWTIGYGYYPERAIWGLSLLTGLSWIIFRRAKLAGAMSPTDKEACEHFNAGGGAPKYYPPFSPLVYSVENSLPLVKLGQAERWQPNPDGPKSDKGWRNWWNNLKGFYGSSAFLRRFLWFQIILGWILATFFLAGLTGLVQK